MSLLVRTLGARRSAELPQGRPSAGGASRGWPRISARLPPSSVAGGDCHRSASASLGRQAPVRTSWRSGWRSSTACPPSTSTSWWRSSAGHRPRWAPSSRRRWTRSRRAPRTQSLRAPFFCRRRSQRSAWRRASSPSLRRSAGTCWRATRSRPMTCWPSSATRRHRRRPWRRRPWRSSSRRAMPRRSPQRSSPPRSCCARRRCRTPSWSCRARRRAAPLGSRAGAAS
mmetsp:Transcript_28855/g.77077  ORF Transcript_28855/g.77077 Transcript_28855/m.77077 type:complete len:227 (-) Transcript_28855:679-1359(-)